MKKAKPSSKTPHTNSKWLKYGLSAWICFHLLVTSIAPNNQTYLGLRLAPVIEPYSKLFGLDATWSFFAPEPGPPPVFVEWQLEGPRGEFLEKGMWPSPKDTFFLRERQNRRIASARFMLMGEDRAEKMLAPYLCRVNRGAQGVTLWRAIQTAPSLQDVAMGKKSPQEEPSVDRHWISHSFCKEFEI